MSVSREGNLGLCGSITANELRLTADNFTARRCQLDLCKKWAVINQNLFKVWVALFDVGRETSTCRFLIRPIITKAIHLKVRNTTDLDEVVEMVVSRQYESNTGAASGTVSIFKHGTYLGSIDDTAIDTVEPLMTKDDHWKCIDREGAFEPIELIIANRPGIPFDLNVFSTLVAIEDNESVASEHLS